MTEEEDVDCPFCKETGFDLIGLKHHIENHCSEYDNTPGIYDEVDL